MNQDIYLVILFFPSALNALNVIFTKIIKWHYLKISVTKCNYYKRNCIVFLYYHSSYHRRVVAIGQDVQQVSR